MTCLGALLKGLIFYFCHAINSVPGGAGRFFKENQRRFLRKIIISEGIFFLSWVHSHPRYLNTIVCRYLEDIIKGLSFLGGLLLIVLFVISCQGLGTGEVELSHGNTDLDRIESVEVYEKSLYSNMMESWEQERLAREATEKFLVQMETSTDYGLALYRTAEYRQRVVDFYADETGSEEIALFILENAHVNDIPLTLAFSLAWAESGYNPGDISHNSSSVDRGLFQLNSKSFPHVKEADFFDPEVSAKLGLEYLRWCLDAGESEIIALAMYNAGRTRVSTGGTPLMTLEYISKIIQYRDQLEDEFNAACFKEKGQRTVAKEKAPVRLVLDTKKGIK